VGGWGGGGGGGGGGGLMYQSGSDKLASLGIEGRPTDKS